MGVEVNEAPGLGLLAGCGCALHAASWLRSTDGEQTYATTPQQAAAASIEGTAQWVPEGSGGSSVGGAPARVSDTTLST